MDQEAVVFPVADGLLESGFGLVMAFTDGASDAGADSELQAVFSIQEGDQILDSLEVLFVKIAVGHELKAVGDGVDGEVVAVLPPKVQKVFVECNLQILPVMGSDGFRIYELNEDHQLAGPVLLV